MSGSLPVARRQCARCARPIRPGIDVCDGCGSKDSVLASEALSPSAAAFCPMCGAARQENAAFCPKCGAPYRGSIPDSAQGHASTPQAASGAMSTGALVTVAGGILAIIGAILPWASVLSISVSGLQGDGMISAGAGAVALLVGILCLRKRMSTAMAIWAILAGLVALGIAVLDGPNIAKQVSESGMATMGPGIYVTGLGGLLSIIGGVLGRRST